MSAAMKVRRTPPPKVWSKEWYADLERRCAELRARNEKRRRLESTNTTLRAQNTLLRQRVEKLESEIRGLNHRLLFGRRS